MEKQVKKRILFINTVSGKGSTGKICADLYDIAQSEGYDCCIAYGRDSSPNKYNSIKIGNKIDLYCHGLLSRLFDKQGYGSYIATKNFLKEVDKFKPDIIHLHNVHGYYLNMKLLFNYLKEHSDIKVIWTLHDSWAYTGHCAYYLSNKCYKWKDKCNKCQYLNEYPKSFIDNSENNFSLKKQLFTSLNNEIIIVPVSNWLNKEVKESFFKSMNISVIHSGIDTEIFKYRENNIKEKLQINDKKMILGVASVWDKRKGLEDFIELSKLINSSYVIVLIGLSDNQISGLPNNIIGLSKTTNAIELAEYYSAADVFFNPSKEETYGLTNVEAQCCGTTVVSYDSGGTSETLKKSNTYLVKNVTEFINLLNNNLNLEKQIYDSIQFDKVTNLKKYLELYKD